MIFTVADFLVANPDSTVEPLLHSFVLLLSVAPVSRSLCRKVSSGGTPVLDLSVQQSEESVPHKNQLPTFPTSYIVCI